MFMKTKVLLYKQMYKIRRVEENILDLFSQGLISGTTHTCIGQETCAVGVVNAIDTRKDVIFSNHRAHGHYIAYTDDIRGLFSEIMGKREGICGGIGGSQHIQSRNFYTNGIQGGIVPVATGMALAEKIKKTGAIIWVFMGDGTLGQGVVYESLNIASLWKLPIIFIVEANKYAQSTPTSMQLAGEIETRAQSFRIQSECIDASDVMIVYESAKAAAEKVRATCTPFFLVLHTYRLAPHSKGDDFRSKEEIEIHRLKDPLISMKSALLEDGIEVGRIEETVDHEISLALEEVSKCHSINIENFHQQRSRRSV